MEIGKYIKRKMAMLSLAMARVEKSSLNQVSDALGGEGNINETMEQGSMANNLLKGVITMEVKELRWRMYKILNKTDSYQTSIIGYDKDGLPITSTTSSNQRDLKMVNKDDYDPYDVELVVNNDEVMKSTQEAFSNETLDIYKNNEKRENKNFDLVGAENLSGNTLAELSFDNMISTSKSDKSVYVDRSTRPKFEIEEYTKKLIVRNIDDKTKLLEFYLSKYPDEFNRKSRLLISEIKKLKENPRRSDLMEINKVGFVTYKTIGAPNDMEYIYQIKNFDKIIEFNGHYVIKFIAEPIINGVSLFGEYKLDELEERYRTKEQKKQIK